MKNLFKNQILILKSFILNKISNIKHIVVLKLIFYKLDIFVTKFNLTLYILTG
jgi:hypothetical protein